MAARGWGQPSEKRSIQVPCVMRHTPFPGTGRHLIVDHISAADHLEKRMAVQAADADQLLTDNRRLVAAHTALKEELSDTQHQVNSMNSHLRSVQTESDIQVRVLLDKIAKMEAEIMGAENLRKELSQAHIEAHTASISTQDLRLEIQEIAHQLQMVRDDAGRIPEMLAELDALRQEHQRLRGEFEGEKRVNMEQVEKMEGKEREMLAMARELETLQAGLLKAENMTPYGEKNEKKYSSNMDWRDGHEAYPTMSGRPADGAAAALTGRMMLL